LTISRGDPTACGARGVFSIPSPEAETSGHILYNALHSALDRSSDQLAKLVTGQKTDIGGAVKDVGQGMVKDSIKSAMMQGLGQLGSLLGIKKPQGKPDGTQGNPFHVVLAGQGGGAGAAGAANPLGAAGGILSHLGPFGAIIKNLFPGSGGGAAAGGAASGGVDFASSLLPSAFSFLAEGGDVDPGHAYVVGDGGEPEVFTPHTAGTITPAHKMGGDYNYHIDARGADLGAANRVARAIEAAHNAAVINSVRAQAERAQRVPKRSGG
jgi:hypothetical protein